MATILEFPKAKQGQTAKEFLIELSERQDIEAFCLIAFDKEGNGTPCHIHCNRSMIAFASLILGKIAVEDAEK